MLCVYTAVQMMRACGSFHRVTSPWPLGPFILFFVFFSYRCLETRLETPHLYSLPSSRNPTFSKIGAGGHTYLYA